jgi:rhamnogalacturonan acetylesterase
MKSFLFVLFSITLLAFSLPEQKPVVYLIGDSTVKNGSGKGSDALWGWGDFLATHFDTTRIRIENHARGGRSSRTYQTEGLWDNVLSKVKPGDFVILQFGHNDGGAVNDSTRARGSLKGSGEDTVEIDNILTKKHEVVHTYGWYIRKYIADTKAKGATPIVCSLVARNVWKDGKVQRASESYTLWAREAANAEGALFIDLNDRVASHYEKLGPEEVKSKLFLKDHTHTTKEGAEINANIVAESVRELSIPLSNFLKK